MQFLTISAALALVGTAIAQTSGFCPITKPETGEVVAAGSTYTIKWQSTTKEKVSLGLIGGSEPKFLVPLGNFATGVDGGAGEYAWKVDPTLGKDATYGIVLTLESNTTTFQYSFPFSIKGGSSGSSNGTASSSPATSAATSYATSSKPSSTPIYSTPIGNLSTTLAPTSARSTATTVVVSTSTGTSRASSSSSVPTNAAGHVAAGSLALIGGIAAAVFAL